MNRPSRILLYGVGSYRNHDCEALTVTTLMGLKKVFPEAKLTVASYDFEHNRKQYKNLVGHYVKHYKKEWELNQLEKKQNDYYKSIPFDYRNFELLYQNAVVNEIKQADLLISVGGDNYCYGYNEWLYALNEYAKLHHKKSILFGASLYEELHDPDLIEDMRRFDLLVLRESISYAALAEYIPKEKLMLAPDPAFALEPKKIKESIWEDGKEYIGLNLSPLVMKNSKSWEAIYKWIDHILQKTKNDIILIPHVVTEDCNDLSILEKIKEKYQDENRVILIRETYDANELKYIISKCKALLAARTHASIAAYSTFVPTLVLGYSVKSKGIARDIFGSEDNYVISYENLTEEILVEKFDFILNHAKSEKIFLQEKVTPMIKKAHTIMQDAINQLQKNERNTVCDKLNCTGCGLCQKVCPKGAITLVPNEEGFFYPKINLKKCIDCNVCRMKCPILHKENLGQKSLQKTYACKNKNDQERKKASSGGIFASLAEVVIAHGGIVYGAQMDQKNHVVHKRVDSIKELDLLKGSKYSQSVISHCYEEVKRDLKSNKEVLFVGVPCQIAALKSYLETQNSDKLITVSLVCHGVLNDHIFHKYLKSMNGKVEHFQFRDKRGGWEVSSVGYDLNRRHHVVPFQVDPLMWIYLNNILLRESCYRCHWKKNSISDITLGDYWGVGNYHPDFLDSLGVSAVIVNTQKGKDFFEKIKRNIEVIPSQYDWIKQENPMIEESCTRPVLRDKAPHYYQSLSFYRSCENTQKFKSNGNIAKSK